MNKCPSSLLGCLVLLAVGCGPTKDDTNILPSVPNILPSVPNLIFQTGFEPDTEHLFDYSTPAPCTDNLFGVDRSVPDHGDWESDLVGGIFGDAKFCFGGGTQEQRSIALLPDPDDADNQVLLFRIDEPGENVSDNDEIACNDDPTGSRKARIQHVLNENSNLTQLDYRLRMRLGEGFQRFVDQPDLTIDWMTIGEYWSHQTNGDRSRVTISLVKPDEEGPFYFAMKADWQLAELSGTSDWTHTWPEAIAPDGVIVSDIEAPIGSWFMLEVSLTAGDGVTGDPGHLEVHVTLTDGERQEVAVVDDTTVVPGGADANANHFDTISTMKLYTMGALMCGLHDLDPPVPLEVWLDDYAIGGR